MSGTLFVVATPIGNLEDLTPRARQTLETVGLIAAEDTRHTGRLLMHIGAKTRQTALHDHNESEVIGGIIEALKSGGDVALVSDAGTPLVSDPGYRLVRAAHDAGLDVVPIPGASAVTAALSAAGLATDRFCFEGFAPAKPAARRAWFEHRVAERRTLIIYESVHRIVDSLADMAAVFGEERDAFVGRELTKLHEQCVQDSLGNLAARVASNEIPQKGEFVIVVSGNAEEASDADAVAIDVETLMMELGALLPAKEVAGISARLTGRKKNALYKKFLELRDED